MAHMLRQDDLTNEEEVLDSVLPSTTPKRSAGKASPDCVKKRRAVDKEVECNVVQDEGDAFSKQLCQPATPEDENQSQIESHNPRSVESLQSCDYWCTEMNFHDEDAERLVTVENFTFDPVIWRRELAKMIILH